LCRKFIDFALSPQAQAAFCAGVIAGPVNRTAAVTDKIKQRVPPIDQLRVFDWFKILPQMQTLADRWNQEVSF
jgi:putative spermidine/putrescine transport system substrate-binding protein